MVKKFKFLKFQNQYKTEKQDKLNTKKYKQQLILLNYNFAHIQSERFF